MTPVSPELENGTLLRRLKLAVAALSSLLILLVTFAWLHGSEEASFNPIAQAAQRTQRQPGSRIVVLGAYTPRAGMQALTMHGTGVYNGRAGTSRQRMTIEMPGSLAPMRIESVGDRRMVYLRSSQLAAGLPPQTHWLGIQVGLGRSAQTAIAGSSDSRDQLEILRAVGDGVDDLGTEELRGSPTTHYKSSVTMGHVADLLAEEGKASAAHQYEQLAELMPEPMPIEAWVDESGLVRRIRMGMQLPSDPGAPPIVMDMTIEFFDFGIEPKIQLPPASQVFDSTLLSRADLHLLDGSSWGVALRPPASHPLPAASFRKRASAICDADTPRQLRMARETRALTERVRQLTQPGGDRNRDAALRVLHEYGTRYGEPMVRIAVRELRKISLLAPPAALRQPTQDFLRSGAVALEASLAQTRALELGAISTARELQPQVTRATQEAKAAAKRAGLTACHENPRGP